MKRQLVYLPLIVILSIQWSGCSTSRALVNYKTVGEESKIQVNEGSVNGKSLGIAKGDEGGAIWANCTKKAEESMRMMLMEAKDKGGNAVGDIKWFASGDSTPSCKKGWGYLIVWPFILTPLFMSTAVEAQVYKLEGGKNHTGLIMIPKSRAEEETLIKKLALGAI
jgi:hypothetical protein